MTDETPQAFEPPQSLFAYPPVRRAHVNAREASHYRALANYYALRARWTLLLTFIVSAALLYVLTPEAPWAARLIGGVLLGGLLFGAYLGSADEYLKNKYLHGPLSSWSSDIARRDAKGVNYYDVGYDGRGIVWHISKGGGGSEEDQCETHHEALVRAMELNSELVREQNFIGPTGETAPRYFFHV